MGAKSSKSSSPPPSTTTPKYFAAPAAQASYEGADLFLQHIQQDLARKRPLSVAIPELATLTDFARRDANSSSHNPQDDEDEDEDDEDDGAALVYVFNPDRIVSQRISKRVTSFAAAAPAVPAPAMVVPSHYTLVNTLVLPPGGGAKRIDLCVLGRTGSDDAANRHLCQDEAHFELTYSENILCFGCFDGHGADGHVLAQLCAQQLSSCVVDDQSYLLQQQQPSQVDYNEVVRGGMESLVRRIAEISPNRADTENSGCTAAIGVVDARTGTVHVANVGDTRVIGAKKDTSGGGFALVQLSQEHILSVEAEADRIREWGGEVRPAMYLAADGGEEFVGPPRCFFPSGSDVPGLMISRTLGDLVARRIGVNSVPDVFSAAGLAFVVLASDGLWEVMTSEDVIQFVGQRLNLAATGTGAALAQLVCVEAHKRWMQLEQRVGDDISCVVLVMEE